MGGLAFQTRDNWLYTVRKHFESLVAAGTIRCSDFRDDEAAGRSHFDVLGKLLTVFQCTWVTGTIIARAICSLPVSPLEIGTIAYVACGALIYAFWWVKPNDMTIQIIHPLPYERSETPSNVMEIMDEYPMDWQQLRAAPIRNSLRSSPQASKWYYRIYFFDVGNPTRHELMVPPMIEEFYRRQIPTHTLQTMIYSFVTLIALIFSGIHVAEYVASLFRNSCVKEVILPTQIISVTLTSKSQEA